MKRFFFILVLPFFISSCDLFTTREAEKPDQPKSTFIQPVEAAYVIQNLISSLQDKNVENYLACLSDSNFSRRIFVFIPSAGAASQFPALADEWDKKNEEQYFNNLKSRLPENAGVALTLSDENYNLGDSTVYTGSYSLNVPHNDNNIPIYYQGEIRLVLIRDSRSLWTIAYWEDVKSGDVPSWSELKGRFY